MYPDMDLGLQGLWNGLKGWGLGDEDANLGTAMLAPGAYNEREKKLKAFSLGGFPGLQEPPPPKPPQEIDLSFTYGGFPQAAPGAAKAQGFPEPAVQLNPTPVPPPKPMPVPDVPPAPFPRPAEGEDFQIQPAPASGMSATPQGRPYQMAQGDAKYQSPGNLADAIAAAAFKGRTGRPTEEFYASKGLDQAAGPNDLGNLRVRAAMKDPDAVRKLEYLANNPRFASAMFGGLEHEQAALEEARRKQAFDMEIERQKQGIAMAERGMGLQERGQREQGRQFDVNADLKRNQQALDSAFQNKEIDLKTYQAQTARNAAESLARSQTRGMDLQETDPNRLLGLEKVRALREAEAAAPEGQMSPARAALLGLPSSTKSENELLDLELKQAQVDLAKQSLGRAATGQMDPAKERQAVQAAGNAAQQMVDQGMSPEEAGRRAAAQYGVKPELVPAAQYSNDPRAMRQNLMGLGFPDEKAAYKAALDAVVSADPKLRSLFGNKLGGSEDRWLFQSSPMQDDSYRAAKQAEIVREMISRGIPAPYAAKIATQYTRAQ